MGVTQLAFTSVGWQNGEKLVRLARKFDFDPCKRKSSLVNASARNV